MAWAQDSVANLETVRIHESMKNMDIAALQLSKQHKIDEETLQLKSFQNIDALLQQQSSIFIKSNGLNSNASLSIRGASPAQNSVLWNGININNTAMGAADISTIPSGIFEDITLIYGSNTTTLGSGSTGGTLSLSNNISFHKNSQLKLNTYTNSLNNKGLQASGEWSNDKWYFKTSLYAHHHKNVFQYDDAGVKKQLEHAIATSNGVLVDAAHLVKHNDKVSHILSLHTWISNNERQIPKAIFESNSLKTQKENDIKLMVQYQIHQKRTFWNIKAAYLKSNFHYDDLSIALHTKYITHSFQNDIQWNYKSKSFFHKDWTNQVTISLPTTFQQLSNNNTQNGLNRIAGVVSFTAKHKDNHAMFAINARQEWNNHQRAPFTPQFMGKYRIYHSTQQALLIKASTQKTYRLPTLNEWYYFPGGNTFLKPEVGWSHEGGLQYFFHRNKHAFQGELTYFHRDMKDWIYWLGGAIWTPHNIAAVRSTGWELQLRSKYNWTQNLSTKINWNTTLSNSVTQASYIPNDKSIGMQIPYSPRTIHQFGLLVQYKNWSWLSNMQYIGYRFTTNDESNFMPDYWVVQTQIQKKWILHSKHHLHTSIHIENLGNTQYQIVNGRPMPPLYIGIQIQWLWH